MHNYLKTKRYQKTLLSKKYLFDQFVPKIFKKLDRAHTAVIKHKISITKYASYFGSPINFVSKVSIVNHTKIKGILYKYTNF